MSYKVALRLNATGEVRVVEMNHPVHVWDETQAYMWREGTYSTDTNRAYFFFTDDEWTDVHEETYLMHNHEAFDVLYVELPTGKRISIDDPINAEMVSGCSVH